jgi:hypothetical protein
MLIQAYLVESCRHGSLDDPQPEPVPVGIVHFIGGIKQEHSEEAATELLSHFSPLTNHPILGFERWEAELISVDEESLGIPTYDVASESYRIWLAP